MRTFHAFSCALLIVGAGCSSPDTDPEKAHSGEQQRVERTTQRLEQSSGGRLVLDAIEAHGGLAAWYRAPTSSYRWTYANKGANLQFTSFMMVNNQTRTAYHELTALGPYGNPQPIDARFAWNGTRAWIYADTLQQPNPHFWALTGFYFEQIPFVLADPGLTYTRLPDDTLDGVPYDMVKVGFTPGVGDSPGDTYTLYVHPETRRVDAIRYTVSYGRGAQPGDLPQTLFYYEDYITVDGLTVPTHFRGYTFQNGARGAPKNEAWADSISFRRPFDPSKLEAPAGARFVEPPA